MSIGVMLIIFVFVYYHSNDKYYLPIPEFICLSLLFGVFGGIAFSGIIALAMLIFNSDIYDYFEEILVRIVLCFFCLTCISSSIIMFFHFTK